MDVEEATVEEVEDSAQPSKKMRVFSAKEFRKKLVSSEKVPALQQFVQLCNNPESERYIFEYLESGGSCLELFQLLEVSTEVPAILVLEVAYHVLLQIASKYAHVHTPTREACQYFLNTHLALINKMLSLASTSKERKVVLKLLTVIVTFSRSLAKDVLLHVSFNPTNLEVLSKQTGDKDGVRNVFIHFLVSFLVEGEYPTLSILLEKKGLLTSIVNGMQYDLADTVCMVLLTLKNNILQNPLVSKTTKMNVFSTPVVRDIVNLYNWKGPQGFSSKKKFQQQVDEHDKARVSEAVHDFLLVLCTSHKYGVIFRDYQLGLGKKTHNSLMYTVLESLERPWEHSYAGELVTKICAACPDLVKTMWANLKTILEPRATERWLNAMKYAAVLVQELKPTVVEFTARSLNASQLAQVVQFLIAPTPILRTIIPPDDIFERSIIKHQVLQLLVESLKAIHRYFVAAENWLQPKDLRVFKNLLTDNIHLNFPSAENVMWDWPEPDELETYSISIHLETVLDLLNLYSDVCPQLLESLSNVEPRSILKDIQKRVDQQHAVPLQIRTIKLFANFEPSIFSLQSKLFETVFPLIFRFYFQTKDSSAKDTLWLLFRHSGIFEDCLEEIDVWINSIYNLTSFDEVGQVVVKMLKFTAQNIREYYADMNLLESDCQAPAQQQNFEDLLENLCGDSSDNSIALAVKHQHLSPLLLGTLGYLLTGAEQTKNFRVYLNSVIVNLLHLQTFPFVISTIVMQEKHQNLISKHVIAYYKGWTQDDHSKFLPPKSKMSLAQALSSYFLEGDVDSFFKENEEEIMQTPGQLHSCFRQSLFYFCNLSGESLSKLHLNNFEKVVKFLLDRGVERSWLLEAIFRHPAMLNRFSFLHLDKNSSNEYTTAFLLKAIKTLFNGEKSLEKYLKPFRVKLVTALKRILKKPGKKAVPAQLLEALDVFALERLQCVEVLQFCSELPLDNLELEGISFRYKFIVYALNKYLQDDEEFEPLSKEIVSTTAQLLMFLNKRQDPFDCSDCACTLRNLLNKFPQHIDDFASDLFASLVTRNEFCKENALLAGFLLKNRKDFVEMVEQNLPSIINKKGLALCLFDAAYSINASEELLKSMYESFEPSIIKSLEKPHKAGQHFETYKDVVCMLIEKFMAADVCCAYVEKVEKFEVGHPFHAHILISVFSKVVINSSGELIEKYVNNAILTLVHIANSLFKKISKSNEDLGKASRVIKAVNDFIRSVLLQNLQQAEKISYRTLCDNQSFQLFCKFCLKFGVSGDAELVKVMKLMGQFMNFTEDEARLLLEMAGSHSEFLDVVLAEETERKVELVDLLLVLCQRWPSLMQRNHIPVLLGAYRATVSPADRIILMLLQMYEKSAAKTNFYDFKPFLWGTAAATHYSVRQDIQKSLWRQPKMGDILENLKIEHVLYSITNYPLDNNLVATRTTETKEKYAYDLAFFLPLFSLLLAPENEAATYKFAKSGGLTLTIGALSSNNPDVRLSACYVLARLHYHIEARQGGKDRLLWQRFVEAICRGTAALDKFKLNNFASVFWAKMALVLTQPMHSLYVPLSQYMGAKESPNLNTVPELYTFLHSSDVNFKETRLFILEILQEGLRRDTDFMVASHAMAFKLIMELFSSHIADLDVKASVLSVLEKACKLEAGRRLLCFNHGLLSWLFEIVTSVGDNQDVIPLVMKILRNIIKNAGSANVFDWSLVWLIVNRIIDKNLISSQYKEDWNVFLEVVLDAYDVNKIFLTEERMEALISLSESKRYKYLFKYRVSVQNHKDIDDPGQLLVMRWVSNNKAD